MDVNRLHGLSCRLTGGPAAAVGDSAAAAQESKEAGVNGTVEVKAEPAAERLPAATKQEGEGQQQQPQQHHEDEMDSEEDEEEHHEEVGSGSRLNHS